MTLVRSQGTDPRVFAAAKEKRVPSRPTPFHRFSVELPSSVSPPAARRIGRHPSTRRDARDTPTLCAKTPCALNVPQPRSSSPPFSLLSHLSSFSSSLCHVGCVAVSALAFASKPPADQSSSRPCLLRPSVSPTRPFVHLHHLPASISYATSVWKRDGRKEAVA